MEENKTQLALTDIEVENNEESEISIIELLYCLLENMRYIIIAALIGLLAMAVYSYGLATPIYRATSSIYVVSSTDAALNLSDLQIGTYLTADYQQVFDSWEMQGMVINNLNLNYSYSQLRSMLSISNPTNTRILNISVTSKNAVEAMMIANEFANVAREYISEVMQTDRPSLLSKALQPTKPVSPQKLRNIVLGFLLGALLASAIIIIRHLLDDKIKTAEDVRRYAGISTLAIVPVNVEMNSSHRYGGYGRKQRY